MVRSGEADADATRAYPTTQHHGQPRSVAKSNTISRMGDARLPDVRSAAERYIDVRNGALFTRAVGEGDAVIVIHGGPGTFDHTYLLPDLDGLADVCRLVYYDQRGHGRFRGELRPDDVSVDRFIEDLGHVCDAFEQSAVTLLGHSWGGHLAMQFAIRHPERVLRLILMNSGPASSSDYADFIAHRRERSTPLVDELQTLASTAAFAEGDPHIFAEFLRLRLSVGVRRPTDLARLQLRMTRENILRGRMISGRFAETLYDHDFDLMPGLSRLNVSALVLHGDYDFVPVTAAEHVAEALRARLVVLPECGHFAYLEAMEVVHAEIGTFLRS